MRLPGALKSQTEKPPSTWLKTARLGIFRQKFRLGYRRGARPLRAFGIRPKTGGMTKRANITRAEIRRMIRGRTRGRRALTLRWACKKLDHARDQGAKVSLGSDYIPLSLRAPQDRRHTLLRRPPRFKEPTTTRNRY